MRRDELAETEKPEAEGSEAHGVREHAAREGTITCPYCGQMLAATCRVCVSCKQAIDPAALLKVETPAPAAIVAVPEPSLPPGRFSWPIFFLTLGVSWLAASLAVAFLGMVPAKLLFVGLTIGSSLWVIFDAQAKRIPKPWRWGTASLILWIAFFPWYLSRRRTPRGLCPFVEGEKSLLPRLLVALFLLQFLLAILVAIKKGPNIP